nr:uncharacterized protein BN887_00021 [Melanopsichium pennsylvanicum 4]
MFKSSVLVAAVLATASAVSAATISTPTALVQCQPVLLTWEGVQGKAYVTILPGKQTSATPLVTFAPQDASSTSIKWVPNLAAGTEVTLAISDDTGVTNYSGTAAVRAGTDTSCLNSDSSAAAAGSSDTTSSSSGSSGSSSDSSSSSGSASSSSSGSSSRSSSTSSPSSSSSTSASSPSSSSKNSTANQKSGASTNAASMISTGLAAAAVALAIFA